MKKFLVFIVLMIAIITTNFSLQSLSFAQSSPIFGPNKYIRTTGIPNSYTDSFKANSTARYNLIVENGEGGKDRISSASISLNGQEIVKESEFNQRIDKIEKGITLQRENTLNIKLSSGPNGFIKLSIYCVSGCGLEVKITSPATGSVINKSKVIVQGNLSNVSGETGVTIQGSGASGEISVLSQVNGSSFAGIISLQQGANTITVTATDDSGYKATDTITVQTDTLQEPIRLTAIPSSGIPTLTVTLEAEANISNSISNYQWDLNGDGIIDQQGGGLSKITASYQYSGLYFPKVTVTDTQGNTYTETAIVNVLSKEEMDALLKGKWEGMRGKLATGDVEGAVGYFADGSKERYQGIFTALKDKISNIAGEMREIQLIYLKNNIAKYRIRRLENAGEITYYIYFELDKNGLWKIKEY